MKPLGKLNLKRGFIGNINNEFEIKMKTLPSNDCLPNTTEKNNSSNISSDLNSPPVEGYPIGRGGSRNSKNYFALPYNPNLRDRAKALRKAGNLPEVILWNSLKKKKFKNLDFDRQKIIGNYIVDFYCPNCNIVIEVDGSSHDFQFDYDQERDAFLQSLGLNVIHIQAKDILQNLDGVMMTLEDDERFTR